MTESEWLASSDPQAMLRLYTSDAMPWLRGAPAPIVSDRKLRLFACACGERCGKSDISESASSMEAMPWALRWANPAAPTWIKGPGRITQTEKAHILRDIVGNPFRPVEPLRQSGGSCGGQGLEDLDWQSPWLTPTVLAIAQAAYEERPGRKCEECNGTGMIGTGYGQFGWKECECCYRTGRIEDGSLDPVTLAILADAMEDAGCREEEDCYCERAETIVPKGAGGQMITRRCHECKNTGRKPSPILSHLRSPGPHVRGCWALDSILGKE